MSRTTVYKAINNSDSIRPETRDRIVSRLVKYGYQVEGEASSTEVPATDTRPVRLGFVAFQPVGHRYFTDDFRSYLRQGIEDVVSKHREHRLTIDVFSPPEREPEKQMRKVREMAASGEYDALMVVPNDPDGMEDVIDEVTSQGAVVVTVNRDIPTSQRAFYVGPDYVKSGRLAGELIGKMASPGKVAIHLGPEEERFAIDLRDRVQGFRKVLTYYPSLEILAPFKFVDDHSFESYLRDLLVSDERLTAIYDVSCNLTRTAELLVEYGLSDKITLVGFDLFEPSANRIVDGSIDAVVYQDLAEQAYIAGDRLYNWFAHGITPHESILETKLEVVLRENIKFFLPKNR